MFLFYFILLITSSECLQWATCVNNILFKIYMSFIVITLSKEYIYGFCKKNSKSHWNKVKKQYTEAYIKNIHVLPKNLTHRAR